MTRHLEILDLPALAHALPEVLAWARKERPSEIALFDRALTLDAERRDRLIDDEPHVLEDLAPAPPAENGHRRADENVPELLQPTVALREIRPPQARNRPLPTFTVWKLGVEQARNRESRGVRQ